MRKIKKALPIALVVFLMTVFLALGVSAADCLHNDLTYQDVTPATCTEDGYRIYSCASCGEYLYDDAVIATGHKYQYSGGLGATCTNEGYEEYTCLYCGDSYTTTVSEIGHDFQEEYHAPTCTKDGWINGLCSCGARSYEPDFYIHLPATGIHVFQDGICIECGNSSSDLCNHDLEYKANSSETHMLYCSKCDSYQGEEQGHSWSNREQLEMVSEFIAKVRYTCSVCNTTTIVTESLTCNEDHNWAYYKVDENYHKQECMTCLTKGETLPHRWDNGVIDQAPSLNVEGYYRYTCLDCNAIKETKIPSLNIEYYLNNMTMNEVNQLFEKIFFYGAEEDYGKFQEKLTENTEIGYWYARYFVTKIMKDIANVGASSEYYAEFGSLYDKVMDKLGYDNIAYSKGYNDAISSVIDKNPVQGLIQGMWSSVLLFVATVANGIGIGGITLMSVLITICIIALVWFVIKLLRG